MQINAEHYTPVKDSKAIPTGEIAPVEGTPFDFTEAKPIGRDIEANDTQLHYGSGYDHNFAIDKTAPGVEKVATAYSPESGIPDGGIHRLCRNPALYCQLYRGTGRQGRSQIQ